MERKRINMVSGVCMREGGEVKEEGGSDGSVES